MSKKPIKALYFIILILAGSVLISTQWSLANNDDEDQIFEELQVFTDVLAIVQSDYVNNPDQSKLVQGAIKGMLQTLDPHSNYLAPSFYDDLETQTRGKFGGLGIEITMKDGLLIVVAPMEDSPASKVGIKSGDKIVKIEGEYIKGYSLTDAVERLRGEKGTAVNITVQREGIDDLIDFKIVRDTIKLRSVKKRYLGEGYGYVRISQFMEGTDRDIKKALEVLRESYKDQNLKGLIIDVRNNPGGLLTQAIKVADIFLEEGIIVYTKGRLKEQEQKFYAKDSGNEPEFPIIVLVNGGSASAAEILAGAFKDHGRALVLGTQSFGKGSVQTVTPLNNGGALTLTTALYYTKSGNSIQAHGVQPDIVVEEKEEEITAKKTKRPRNIRESEIPGAIKNPNGNGDPGLKKKRNKKKSPLQEINKTPTVPISRKIIDPEKTPLKEWLEEDPQFQRAYDLLKTFNIFKK